MSVKREAATYFGQRKFFVRYDCGCIHQFYMPIPEPYQDVICPKCGPTVAVSFGTKLDKMRTGRVDYWREKSDV